MSLGIYNRLWELLEGAATELDLLLAEHSSVGVGCGTYGEYVTALRRMEALKRSHEEEENHATNLDQLVTLFSLVPQTSSGNQQLTNLRQEASKARLTVDSLVHRHACTVAK